MDAMRVELRGEMGTMRDELRAEMAAQRTELTEAIHDGDERDVPACRSPGGRVCRGLRRGCRSTRRRFRAPSVGGRLRSAPSAFNSAIAVDSLPPAWYLRRRLPTFSSS